MNAGIYEIVNTVNGKRYVGSAVNFSFRWRNHRSLLRRGAHHSRHLQSAWAKHGEDTFEFRKLIVCSKEDLIVYEQYAIDALQPEYNICRNAGSSLGVKHSPEFCAKRAALSLGNTSGRGNKGRKASPETRAKLSAFRTGNTNMLGLRHSPETKAKMRAAHAGKQYTLGHKHSPEARANISAALVGNTHALGRKISQETREKMSAAKRGNKNALHRKQPDETQLAASGRGLRDRAACSHSNPGDSGNQSTFPERKDHV